MFRGFSMDQFGVFCDQSATRGLRQPFGDPHSGGVHWVSQPMFDTAWVVSAGSAVPAALKTNIAMGKNNHWYMIYLEKSGFFP